MLQSIYKGEHTLLQLHCECSTLPHQFFLQQLKQWTKITLKLHYYIVNTCISAIPYHENADGTYHS